MTDSAPILTLTLDHGEVPYSRDKLVRALERRIPRALALDLAREFESRAIASGSAKVALRELFASLGEQLATAPPRADKSDAAGVAAVLLQLARVRQIELLDADQFVAPAGPLPSSSERLRSLLQGHEAQVRGVLEQVGETAADLDRIGSSGWEAVAAHLVAQLRRTPPPIRKLVLLKPVLGPAGPRFSIGGATTDASRSVNAAIARIPGYEASGRLYRRWPGGTPADLFDYERVSDEGVFSVVGAAQLARALASAPDDRLAFVIEESAEGGARFIPPTSTLLSELAQLHESSNRERGPEGWIEDCFDPVEDSYVGDLISHYECVLLSCHIPEELRYQVIDTFELTSSKTALAMQKIPAQVLIDRLGTFTITRTEFVQDTNDVIFELAGSLGVSSRGGKTSISGPGVGASAKARIRRTTGSGEEFATSRTFQLLQEKHVAAFQEWKGAPSVRIRLAWDYCCEDRVNWTLVHHALDIVRAALEAVTPPDLGDLQPWIDLEPTKRYLWQLADTAVANAVRGFPPCVRYAGHVPGWVITHGPGENLETTTCWTLHELVADIPAGAGGPLGVVVQPPLAFSTCPRSALASSDVRLYPMESLDIETQAPGSD